MCRGGATWLEHFVFPARVGHASWPHRGSLAPCRRCRRCMARCCAGTRRPWRAGRSCTQSWRPAACWKRRVATGALAMHGAMVCTVHGLAWHSLHRLAGAPSRPPPLAGTPPPAASGCRAAAASIPSCCGAACGAAKWWKSAGSRVGGTRSSRGGRRCASCWLGGARWRHAAAAFAHMQLPARCRSPEPCPARACLPVPAARRSLRQDTAVPGGGGPGGALQPACGVCGHQQRAVGAPPGTGGGRAAPGGSRAGRGCRGRRAAGRWHAPAPLHLRCAALRPATAAKPSLHLLGWLCGSGGSAKGWPVHPAAGCLLLAGCACRQQRAP